MDTAPVEQEVWVPIPGFPGYEVSNFGNVLSLPKHIPHWRGGTRLRRAKQMALQLTKRGYVKVALSVNGGPKSRMVHCLVCAAFHGPKPEGKEVPHLDGVGSNNRASNLAWKTHVENERDKWLHGTVAIGLRNGKYTKPESTPRGEQHGQSKFTEGQIIEIRKILAEGIISAYRLAKLTGVSKTAILYIGNRVNWSHVA